MSGIFISVEGPDGSGKSTLIRGLNKRIRSHFNKEVILTREPGGSDIAEKIREVLLDVENDRMDARTEALLYAASRRQHIVETIQPALDQGKIVLSDRYVDSSLAYQGSGREIGMDEVKAINEFATQGLLPDMTLYLSVDAKEGLNRIGAKNSNRQKDRLEEEDISFHQQVQKGYQKVIEADKERFLIVDARQKKRDVLDQAWDLIKEDLAKYIEKVGD